MNKSAPNRIFITGRAGVNQKAKINLYRVQSALQGSPSASRDQVVSTEKIKTWIRFVCRATARTAMSVTVCARSFAVYMRRIGALSRSLATADDLCCVAQHLYFWLISSLFTRLPDLSQNTPYYSTERTCLADKVGILHIKQKSPVRAVKSLRGGFPFSILFTSSARRRSRGRECPHSRRRRPYNPSRSAPSRDSCRS